MAEGMSNPRPGTIHTEVSDAWRLGSLVVFKLVPLSKATVPPSTVMAYRFAAYAAALGDRFVARMLPDSAAQREGLSPFFEYVVARPPVRTAQ